MRLRLAFSVASHIEPDVLLIDEVLAVGDLGFQEKCLKRLAGFKERGCTGLVVSHDPELVEKICDDAIWLDKGQLKAYGPVNEVMDQYLEATGIEPKAPQPTVFEAEQPTTPAASTPEPAASDPQGSDDGAATS